ncbi:MAG: 4-hydroxy-tetrahydrodipicolinate synthase [Bacillota bacterium]
MAGRKPIRGLLAANITPMNRDGSRVDLEGLERLCQTLLGEWGVGGLVPLGSTGEGLLLTGQERDEVIKVAVKVARGKAPVVVGTTAVTTTQVIDYSRRAAELGADGVLVAPPPYIKPSEEELFQHYKRISGAVDIPVVLYNNPKRVGVDIHPELAARLSGEKNIRFIKESTGDIKRFTQIAMRSAHTFTVLNGSDSTPLEGALLGAGGSISGPANVVGRQLAKILSILAEHGDMEDAMTMYAEITPFLAYLEGARYVATMKAATAMVGLPAGSPREPLLPLTRDEARALRGVMEGCGLI